MATLYIRREVSDKLYKEAQKIALAKGQSLSEFTVVALQQVIEDEKIRQRNARALANIRRNRRALPVGAPDSVEILRQLRESDE